ncbi:hypothetical protein [Mycobacterium sp. DL440]|uniref:hypothetical protein n=1 Tax=Mycobacterium sp. DL440 TaxID=2675523 RepID=UPI00141E45EB|nr:hypothetical protein [Mycobacterium sp. DL440]
MDLTGVTNPVSDPITALIEVLTGAAQNAGTLGGQIVDNGAPVLNQVLANLTGYVQAYGTALQNTGLGLAMWQTNNQWLLDYAYEQLQAGQIGDAISYFVYAVSGIATAMFPMLDTLKIPGAMAQNFADVVQAIPRAVTMIGLSTIVAAQSPFHAFGRQVQGLVDAVNAGDPVDAANAVVNIPAAMTGALLDELLKPYTTEVFTGLVGALVVGVPKIIAEVLKPPASPVVPPAVESAPGTLAADTWATVALPATETPAIEASTTTPKALPSTADQTSAPAELATKQLTSSVTDTVDNLTSAAASAFNAVKTVTLTVDPKPAATETPAASEPSTDGVTAGTNAGTDDDASDTSNTKAAKVSKKEAAESKRQARQQARADRQHERQEAKKEAKADKQGTKSTNSTGGKHRADKNSDK